MVVDRILDNLPRVFVAFYILAATIGFLVTETRAETPFVVGLYAVYASAATIIAACLIALALRSESGLVSRLFVCFMYEAMFFALTLLCVFVLVNIRLASPEALPEELVLLRRISYSALAGSGMGTAIVALVWIHSWRKGALDKLISPWPWPHRRNRARDRTPEVPEVPRREPAE